MEESASPEVWLFAFFDKIKLRECAEDYKGEAIRKEKIENNYVRSRSLLEEMILHNYKRRNVESNTGKD